MAVLVVRVAAGEHDHRGSCRSWPGGRPSPPWQRKAPGCRAPSAPCRGSPSPGWGRKASRRDRDRWCGGRLDRVDGLRDQRVRRGVRQRRIVWRFTGARMHSRRPRPAHIGSLRSSSYPRRTSSAYGAIGKLVIGDHPATSWLGIVLVTTSAIGMPLLGRAKRQLAHTLGSGATHGEGTQNVLCGYLPLAVLAGLRSGTRCSGWWWSTRLPHRDSPPSQSAERASPGGQSCCARPADDARDVNASRRPSTSRAHGGVQHRHRDERRRVISADGRDHPPTRPLWGNFDCLLLEQGANLLDGDVGVDDRADLRLRVVREGVLLVEAAQRLEVGHVDEAEATLSANQPYASRYSRLRSYHSRSAVSRPGVALGAPGTSGSR